MRGIVSVNGQICPPEMAVLPVLDRGFLFGDAVFEVFVSFHNKILNVNNHLTRLRKSAAEINLDIPWTDDELIFELTSLLEQIDFAKKSLRLIVTRGNTKDIFRLSSSSSKPNKIIFAYPVEAVPAKNVQDGIKLRMSFLPYTERGAKPKVTANYLRSSISLMEAERAGFDDVLWVNADSEITESSTANVFFIGRQGNEVEIVTPPESSGILAGITREMLKRYLAEHHLAVKERTIYADEIPLFDEAFLTSTVKGLRPVSLIDKHRLFTLRPNSTYKNLEKLFLFALKKDLGFWVDWNTGEKIVENEVKEDLKH